MAPPGFLENNYNSFQPPGIIPVEYQGWVFLVFVIISFGLLLYGFYYIATNPIDGMVK